MADNSMAKRVKDALITLMTAMTYDAGSGVEPAFTAVIGSTHQEFDGYPVLRVLPDHLDNEIVTNRENDRTLNYTLRVTVPLSSSNSDDKFDYMYDISELMLNTLDQADANSSLHTIDPSISVLKIVSNRGEWISAEADDGIWLLFDVNCAVTYSKDLG